MLPPYRPSPEARLFVQEVGKVNVKKARMFNAVYLRGVLRDQGVDRPYCLYVENFKAVVRVDVDDWDSSEVEDLRLQIKDELDPYAEFKIECLHPTFFNKNKDRTTLAIYTTKRRLFQEASGGDRLWVLNGKQRHFNFLETPFKLHDQFLARTAEVRLQSWTCLPRRVRTGPSSTFFHTGRAEWKHDMFVSDVSSSETVSRTPSQGEDGGGGGGSSDETVYNVAYLRCRFTSRRYYGKQPRKARDSNPMDFLSSASVMIGDRITSFTVQEGSTDDGHVVRDLLRHLRPCDTLVLMGDNYRTSHFLASRAAVHGLALGRMGGSDYHYTKESDNLTYYTLKGLVVLDLLDALKKEYAANKLESHDLVAFMDSEEFAGDHTFGDSFAKFNAAHSSVQSPEDQAMETAVEVRLLKHLAEHTMQLENISAVSKLCDLNIDKCATGGQQERVHHCLYRKCQDLGFYIDHWYFKRHHVIEGSAEESTFRKIVQHWMRDVGQMDKDEFKAAEQRRKNAAKKKYIGGMVYPPMPGFKIGRYIFCCDFAALYPSIIIAYVLCYASIVFNGAYPSYHEMMDDPKMKVRMVKISDTCSVPIVVSYDGEPPRTVFNFMVADLLQARHRYKKKKKEAAKAIAAVLEQLKAEGLTPEREAELRQELAKQQRLWNIYEAAQLAAKVTANSAYGFLGTSDEKEIFACNELSAVNTGHGRQMNMEVGEMFSRAPTPELWDIPVDDLTEEQLLRIGFGAIIQYGDTDSVMGDFNDTVEQHGFRKPGESMEHATWRMAQHACACATRLFPKPNEVECEDAYMMMMLFRQVDPNEPNKLNSGGVKKRYICYKASAPGKKPSRKIQGYGQKRRDQPPLTREMALKIIDTIWPMPRPAGYEAPDLDELETRITPILHYYVGRVVDGKMSADDLTVTCKVKHKSEYKVQSNVAVNMIEDHEKYDGFAPVPGSRVPFVYTIDPTAAKKSAGKKGKKGARKRATAYQLNPRFLKKRRMAIDRVKYLETMRNLIMPLIVSFPRARQTFDEILCRAVDICDGARLRMQPHTYLAPIPKDRVTKRGGHMIKRETKKPRWAQ